MSFKPVSFKMIPFIDLKRQQQDIRPEIEKRFQSILDHGQYIMGPEVADLEAALAADCGAAHAISCANGTDALELALRALGIGVGDFVFIPSFTFVATAEAVSLVGATPVFVDIDAKSFNMCPVNLNAALQSNDAQQRVVIPVDLFGLPASDDIEAVAQSAGAKVIADSAQSYGASANGRKVGRRAKISTTSFFPAKPLGCYGDGGALFTDDNDLAELLRSLRNHGAGESRYDNIRVGRNSRLDSFQAAVLLEKLKIFGTEIENRNRSAAIYTAHINKKWAGYIRAPQVVDKVVSVWAQYTVLIEDPRLDREALIAALKMRNVPTAVYYPKCNHLQAPYLDAPRAPGGLPVTEAIQSRVFSLPMHGWLAEETQEQILEALDAALEDLLQQG